MKQVWNYGFIVYVTDSLIDSKDSSGKTYLLLVLGKGKFKIAQYLIKDSSDAMAVDHLSWSICHSLYSECWSWRSKTVIYEKRATFLNMSRRTIPNPDWQKISENGEATWPTLIGKRATTDCCCLENNILKNRWQRCHYCFQNGFKKGLFYINSLNQCCCFLIDQFQLYIVWP